MAKRDPATTSRIMRAVRSKDSRAELAIRRALHARGARYRLHQRDLPGNPDVVFRGERLAIFIDGDFWHGRDLARTDRVLQTRRDYWLPKIERTMQRDEAATKALREAGWTVLRFWETDVLADPERAAAEVLALRMKLKNAR